MTRLDSQCSLLVLGQEIDLAPDPSSKPFGRFSNDFVFTGFKVPLNQRTVPNVQSPVCFRRLHSLMCDAMHSLGHWNLRFGNAGRRDVSSIVHATRL